MTPTPGPWIVESTATAKRDPEALLPDECNFWIVDQGHAGEVLALVLDTSRDEAAANADLLAASPDMYAALRAIRETYAGTEDMLGCSVLAKIHAIDRALAKAEGRS